jgi:hypothetical protein
MAVVSAGISLLLLSGVISIAFVINVQARQKAVAALRAFEEEQARGRVVRRTAAPAMIRAAHALIEQSDLEGASIQVGLAREYDPQIAAAHMLAAQLAIVAGDFDAAENAMSAYLEIEPGDEHAMKLVELCDIARSQGEQEQPTLAFAQTFAEQGTWQLANRMQLDAEKALELYRTRIRKTWGGMNHFDKNVLMRPDGRLVITSNPHNFTTLKPLAGLPIAELRLNAGDNIIDLAPLRGMPLEILSLSGVRAHDLCPLSGAPLQELYIQAGIDHLDGLEGAPLKRLQLGWLKVDDLSPLKGAPIEDLHITGLTELKDIEPLAGMPLKKLRISHTDVKSIAALATCSDLETLYLDLDVFVDFEPLRGLNLKDFWFKAHQVNGFDLSPLEGMALTNFYFRGGVRNADMSALEGMPIESLTIYNTLISDISFVRGMPLKSFAAVSGHDTITDLTPLIDLPLESLIVRSYQLKDITPVAKMKNLVHLDVPDHCDPLPLLDQLPNLKTIGARTETVEAYIARRAEEANQ